MGPAVVVRQHADYEIQVRIDSLPSAHFLVQPTPEGVLGHSGWGWRGVAERLSAAGIVRFGPGLEPQWQYSGADARIFGRGARLHVVGGGHWYQVIVGETNGT